MLGSRIDRAFRRFCATGDPKALATVFDATAEELYRLAWHLTGNRHAAEDLVQATFLVAIGDRKAFDPSRRVLPWLSGILVNRALELRRRQRSRTEALPRRESRVGDPVEAAAASELGEVVKTKVRALPEPYRQVLMLHLLHELSAREIADSIDRPDSTVRSQIQRGLELLRKMLPVGIAGVARASVPPAKLDEVRSAVLAGLAAPAGQVTVTLGGLVMMKKALFIAAALGVLLLLVWPILGSAEPPAVGSPGESGTPTIADVNRALPARELAGERVAVEVGDPVSPITLEVAVHWAGDGEPAPDVTVRYQPTRANGELYLRAAMTNGEGIARFQGVEAGPAIMMADRSGRAEIDVDKAPVQRAELELSGLDIRGIVLDPDDRPVAGAEVWVSINDSTDDGDPVLRTGADGRFLLRSVARGRVVSAIAPGFSTVHVGRVILDQADEEMVLRLRPAPGTLVGQVLSPEGHPVPDARVLVGTAIGNDNKNFGQLVGQDLWPSRFLRTDQEGRFAAIGLPPLKWPVWVGAAGYAPWRGSVAVNDGAETRMAVTLQHGARISGRVVDQDGTPVAGAQVFAAYLDEREPVDRRIEPFPGGAPSWHWPRLTADASGGFRFDNLMPGQVGVFASDEAAGRDATELALLDGGRVTWNPVLSVGSILHGFVTDPDGRALSRWRVNLLAGDRALHAITDSEGRFQLSNAGDETYRITATATLPQVGEEVDLGPVRPGPGPLRVRVPWESIPSGKISGRITGPDGASSGPLFVELFLLRDGRKTSWSLISTEDGLFESALLVAGRYTICAQSSEYGRVELGEWEVARGGRTDLAYEFEQPGHLSVEVRNPGGQRILDAHLRLFRGDTEYGPVGMEEGRGESVLPPGRYDLAAHGELTMTMRAIEIFPGRTTEVVFDVPGGVLFTLRVPPGEDGSRFDHAWRDASGTVVFRGVGGLRTAEAQVFERKIAPGRYTVEVQDWDGCKETTTAEIRADDPPVIVDLVLPSHR